MSASVDALRAPRAWVYLGAAIALELVGILFLKRSQGLALLVPAVLGYVAYGAAFGLLSRVMQVMVASTAYTLWNGLGAVGVTVGGWLIFDDQLTTVTAVGIALAMTGAILINVGRPETESTER